MDAAAQREFVRDHLDADLQFILGEAGVNLANQVAIGRHYGSMRKFSALGDDRGAIRTSCLHDFAIPGDTPENRSQVASIVSAWETAREYLAKEVELRAESKILGQPRVLQIHERQAMLRAVEAIHGHLNEAECPSSDYLSLKAEETETNEPTAAPLDEIMSKQASSNSQIQSTVDSSGHIRVTRTKAKSKMPSSTEEYRRVMKTEMYAWLAMASRYKAKHWLHGLTAEPFLKFVEYILGDRVYGLQIPSLGPSSSESSQQQRIKPDWAVILGYEQKLRKEAMKRVMDGHTLSESLQAVIRDPDLKEAFFTTPMALRASMPDSQPSKYIRYNSKGSFSGKQFSQFPKGKGKGSKGKAKGKTMDPRLKGLNLAWRTPDGRELCFAWNTGDCDGSCNRDDGVGLPSSPAPAKDPVEVPTLKVMYLFAGHQRHSDIGSFLRKAESSGRFKLELMEFDIERSPDHDLTDESLWDKIFTLLKEGNWVLIVSPPCNTFSRARFRHQQHPGPKPLRTRTWPKGFPWLSKRDRAKVDEANLFVERCLKGCEISSNAGGFFFLEHPEDLGAVQGEQPGSIWQWEELLELIPKLGATCFAVHQCSFGAITPKPTRFLTDMHVDDKRCYKALPKFDKLGFYKGPLPRHCGHVHTHKLIGKTAAKWNTAPSALYPPRLCEFIANLIISSGGGRNDGVCKKRKVVQSGDHVVVEKRKRVEQWKGSAEEPAAVVVCDSSSEESTEVEGRHKEPKEPSVEFDMAACGNSGRPIFVEWDNVHRSFIDGFGLCSPCRWKPAHRGTQRSVDMVKLANDTFQILADGVREAIPDVRRESFKLVTGKLTESPFTVECLNKLRARLFELLPDPGDASVVDDGQPFFLRALAQWLKVFGDPDVGWLVDEEDSFASGVYLGVDKPLPRSPQVFPPKLKHRRLDATEFVPIAENYASAQMSVKELEEKFREEEALGRMHPSKLGVLRQEYGDTLRIAAMAAISKPDGSPAEISAIVRESTGTREAPFCVSADIKAAHRLVKIRSRDWGYMCCRSDSSSDVVWVNHTGTFGISSAPYWWAKLAGLIGRFVGYLFHQRWFMQMIYVDDLHGAFVGAEKFLNVWVWVLAYELVGVPFGYHKFKGGFSSEFVGFHIRYDLSEVGITIKRGDWLLSWIAKAKQDKYVVQAREFAEFLGRLGFVAQLLIWMKPHLSPLFAWASVTAKGTVGRLPDTVILTLEYIESELKVETFMVSTKRAKASAGECFRTDAKCADGFIVLGGWELSSRKWFSLRLLPEDAPYFFKPDKSSQWASTSAELMASYVALHCFGWLEQGKERRSVELPLTAGTDNQANESLSSKRATTKWPLMGVNMQLSSALAKARLSLGLKWRPREENTEADQLTNEDFSSFDLKDRVEFIWKDLDLSVLNALVETRCEFERARLQQKEMARSLPPGKSKRFDKTPW
eukprot:s367_g18.t1